MRTSVKGPLSKTSRNSTRISGKCFPFEYPCATRAAEKVFCSKGTCGQFKVTQISYVRSDSCSRSSCSLLNFPIYLGPQANYHHRLWGGGGERGRYVASFVDNFVVATEGLKCAASSNLFNELQTHIEEL